MGNDNEDDGGIAPHHLVSTVKMADGGVLFVLEPWTGCAGDFRVQATARGVHAWSNPGPNEFFAMDEAALELMHACLDRAWVAHLLLKEGKPIEVKEGLGPVAIGGTGP